MFTCYVCYELRCHTTQAEKHSGLSPSIRLKRTLESSLIIVDYRRAKPGGAVNSGRSPSSWPPAGAVGSAIYLSTWKFLAMVFFKQRKELCAPFCNFQIFLSAVIFACILNRCCVKVLVSTPLFILLIFRCLVAT